MPLFMPDEELARLSSDAASVVAERADEYIRKIYAELDSVRAKADAASITAEQTCSLLEQKYLSLSQDFSSLESQNAKLQSDFDDRLAELAQSQAQKHQLHLQSIEKDGEVERMSTEMSELHKSKRQLMELLEQKDAEISEKNSTIKSYLDKIVKLTDTSSEKEARLAEATAELARSQAMCSRLSQEKELTERHAKWLDEELTAKVDSYAELRRRHSDLESEMSAKLVDVEKNYIECSSSLNWHKERLRELETKIGSLQEDLSSCKDAATTTEEQYTAELFTANKLVDLYKESSEEWSRKAGELEGVIKALEARLSQVESSYKERLDKEVSTKQLLEKENGDLKQKLEKCEAEIEKTRKTDELNLIPFSNFTRRVDNSGTSNMIEESQAVISKVPAGVSGTALAASLLRDGWSLAKIYEKYQEAVDAMRHEQLGRKEAEMILQRVLSELEEKAGFIQEERGEYERVVEAYCLVNQKLQDSVSEQSNMEKFIMELKADLRRRERENTLLQKDISDLQKQVTILLKECRDVQLRCGAARDDDEDDYPLLSDVEMEMESEADKIISEHLLKFKDINGLVEQNVKLRNLVRSLSEQIESRETELKETFEVDLKNKTDEASAKVATVLKRAEEQGQMIESLHTSVAMYKRLYEEEQKLHSSDSRSSDLSPAVVPGRKNFLHLLEDSEEATKRAQEKAFERIRILEEDFAKARSEVIAIRSERDKLAMEANFAREKLEGIMKESERKREEMNSVLARNIEFSQLIIDHQRKLRESSESLHAAEEISRKLSMEVSVLKQEKELLSNAEKRASDEVSALSQRVYRLQATLDTVQSTEEVREETRAAERRKQEEHIKQLQREWAEAKKELQEERSNARDFTSDRNQTLNNAVMQVEEMGKELANALKAVSVAESRASVAEARLSDLEKKIRSSDPKTLDMDSGGIVSLSDKEMSIELRTAKEEIEKLRGEVESSKSHMLQYKSIAQVNETALKQMESAHENFRLEAEKRQRSLEAELVSLRERVSELENDCIQKSEQLATAAAGKEDALLSASAEIASLREENLVKKSQIEAMNIQMSTLKNDLETEHEKWRVAQRNYERQVILLSETIQELTKTSQALAALQEEASELRKLADARGIENSELNAKWSEEKLMLEQQKNLAEKKYHELNEQNKLLHSRLEAKHLNSAEKNSRSGTISSGSTDSDHLEDSGLQRVVHYLRRTKEIAETEISLMRQEKLRLQSQLESALKMAESARGSLTAERASTRASLLTDDGIKSLQLQVSEMNLLRESNMQLREENKHNFEKCQEMREVAQKARMESENFENLLKTKQTELDLCMKEMEKLRMETDLHKKRVDELRETYRNIDIADYNRLKDEVRQLEEKLKAKDAHAEDCKKVLLEKQNKISLLEKELTNCKKDLSEREKRLDDAQQAQATMQSEFNKQKQELEKNKKIHYTLNMTKRKYEKEKDELSKQNQSLAKQLEEAKEEAGKRTTTDAVVEQSVKEREEKEKRIQILDKYVHQLKDEVRKKTEDLKKKDEELTKERSERKSVEKEVGDSLTKIKKEKTKVDEELAKLERYQTALTHLSEELEKLKHADGNLPEGTSAVQVLSGSILNDQAAAYVSAVEYFERVARSIASNSQVSTKPTDMVTEPSSGIPAAEPSTMTRVPSSTPLIKSPVATTQQLPKVASDNKEKRLISQKPSTEFRRPSGRRIVRPQLVKPEESPKVDVDMPEAEGTGDEGKQPAAHEPESQVTTSVRPVQTLVRKRQADSLVSEPQQDSLTQGETSSEIAPPASKKAKGSESHPDTSEGENLAKEPAIDELMDATTTTDGDNEETEAENAEEKTVQSLRKIRSAMAEKETPAIILQFAPLNSSVDEGFWHSFSSLKLDKLGIDDSPISITGFYGPCGHPQVSNHLTLLSESLPLDEQSLIASTSHGNRNKCPVPGILYNTNTVESFNKLDKQSLLKAEANKIWEDIQSGKALEDPSVLPRFLVISFADLKKWSFRYWFAFPAFVLDPPVSLIELKPASEYFSSEEAESVSAACNDWRDSDLTTDVPFFLVSVSSDSKASIRHLKDLEACQGDHQKLLFGFYDPCHLPSNPGWPLRNYLALIRSRWNLETVWFFCYRESRGFADLNLSLVGQASITLSSGESAETVPNSVGWELNKGKRVPRSISLANSMDPTRLAVSAVDLNLKLMRWRALPSLNLNVLSSVKCLLLGAGTLGCQVARTLMGWGIRNITFVDYGKVAMSNPVRQSLYNFEDCLGRGEFKAVAAVKSLKQIFPAMETSGVVMAIPMPGHPISSQEEDSVLGDCKRLSELIESHDAVFLLTDTRESRWLPSLLCANANKIAINAALGFDSYMVMRHGAGPTSLSDDMQNLDINKTNTQRLGCYFCNDVVAPQDSMTDRTLDQQCTVTRPGLAPIAGALAVELLVGVLQHPLGINAKGDNSSLSNTGNNDDSPLGILPHQIRGSVSQFSQITLLGQASNSCTACSETVISEYRERGNSFILEAINHPTYLEDLTGLTELKKAANSFNLDWEDDDTDDDDVAVDL